MDDAIGKAAALAKLGDERGVTYLDPPTSWKDELFQAFADNEDDEDTASQDAFATLARGPERQLAAMLAEIRSILAGPSIQARCIECGGVAPAVIRPEDKSLLATLVSWLS
jgi:protease-4